MINHNAIHTANIWIEKFPTNNKSLTAKDLINGFTDEELAAMRDLNECEEGRCYEGIDECDMPYCIVIDYVIGWLKINIEEKTMYGTDHLFKIYKMLCCW